MAASAIPSNSLAALYGLARDCAARRVLGDDVALDIEPVDETNTRVKPHRLADDIERDGAGMVMLVGVQSIQFPRARSISRSRCASAAFRWPSAASTSPV